MIDAAVDVIVVDVAHGHNRGVVEMIRRLKRETTVEDVSTASKNDDVSTTVPARLVGPVVGRDQLVRTATTMPPCNLVT